MQKEKIIQILNSIDGGKEILDYITELEDNQCECGDKEHHHDDDCSCGHHHHDDDCDCGCHDEEDEWNEITPKNYTSKFTVKDWEELLKDTEIFDKDSLIIVKRMRHVASPTSSAELADMFGYGALYYSMEIEKLAKRIAKKFNITELEQTDIWAIVLVGWKNKNAYNDTIYALRSELYEAIGNIDMSSVPLRMD